MPARKFDDVERIKQLSEKNVEMLITMHTGLSEITKVEASLDGGVAMRYIAEQTLARVEEVAAKLEVLNA